VNIALQTPKGLAARDRQRGFSAITLILASIVLIGVLTAAASMSMNKNQSGMAQSTAAQSIVAQTNLISGKILKCVADYPAGDNGSGNHVPYPYYGTAPNTGVAATGAVSGLYCPGSGSAGTSDATDANLFSGTDGIFLSPQPSGFSAWSYVNDGTNVRILLQASSAANATAWATALTAAAAKFSASQASIVTTTWANDTLQYIITL